MRRGTAKRMDHAQLVHAQWLHAVRSGMRIFVKRVSTHDNIADLPSREASAFVSDWLSNCSHVYARTSGF